jgi:hypothetical protein
MRRIMVLSENQKRLVAERRRTKGLFRKVVTIQETKRVTEKRGRSASGPPGAAALLPQRRARGRPLPLARHEQEGRQEGEVRIAPTATPERPSPPLLDVA